MNRDVLDELVELDRQIDDLRARLRAIAAIASDPASTVASMSHVRDLCDLARPLTMERP